MVYIWFMKPLKNQPVQTIVTHFKKKGLRKFKLNQDCQQGVKKLVFTVVLMYQDMPEGETIRLNASAGEYEFDVKAGILPTPGNACVYHAELIKKPDEILQDLIVGVSTGVYVFILVQAL